MAAINETAINETAINETAINDYTSPIQTPPIQTEDHDRNQDNSANQANLPPIATKDMDVTFVQDVSGSMEAQRVSVVNGINEIIRRP